MPEQQGTETVLTGLLPDAAALFGVLSAVEALGLDLLEVRRVRPRQDVPDRPGPGGRSVRPNHPHAKGDAP
ncbi:hypothetical protein [Streptomyces phaeochromogenes]|uniref:hypothetical protein n=1 Tax=Streptomyces phaeochromogenes TaxID=1923 RepID=UPI0033F86918